MQSRAKIPAVMRLRSLNRLLAPFEPDASAMLHWLQPLVDDEMLEEIAACDAPFETDNNLEQLREIREKCAASCPLKWNPKEVLELTRWDAPDAPSTELTHRAHVKRAFACAALLEAGGHKQNDCRMTGEESTLIVLIESASFLGSQASRAALRAITAAMLSANRRRSDLRPQFALATLMLALSSDRDERCPQAISALPNWFEEEWTFWHGKPVGFHPYELEWGQRVEVWQQQINLYLNQPFRAEGAGRKWAGDEMADWILSIARTALNSCAPLQ